MKSNDEKDFRSSYKTLPLDLPKEIQKFVNSVKTV